MEFDIYKEHDVLYGNLIPSYFFSSSREREVSLLKSKEVFLRSFTKSIDKKTPKEMGVQWTLGWRKKPPHQRKSLRLLTQTLLDSRLLGYRHESEETEAVEWLALYTLTERLLGKVTNPFLISDMKERHLVGVSLVLLNHGEWNLSEKSGWSINLLNILSLVTLSGYRVSTVQTLGSRLEQYQWWEWFTPSPIVVSEQETHKGIPYSDYCKGYGWETPRRPKRQKLPYTSETDGNEEQEQVLIKDSELATFYYLVDLALW